MAKTLGDITRELNEKVLAPARSEADEIIADARKQSDSILVRARTEAERIRSEATGEAEHLRAQMNVDMETASRNFIIMVQEKLEASVVNPVIEEEIKSAFADVDFLKKTIEVIITEFAKSRGRDHEIELFLPEKQRSELEQFFIGKFREKAEGGLMIRFTDKISFGFRIGAGAEGESFNFSSGLVEAFIAFCSPRFRKYFLARKEP